MITVERGQKNIAGKDHLTAHLLTASCCVTFFGAMLNLAGIKTEILIAAGASLTALYPLLCSDRKSADRTGAIIIGILLVVMAITWKQCGNGGKIYMNRLFLQSAERQQYQYQMYEVNGAGLPIFISGISAVIATAAGWISTRNKTLCGIIFFVTVAAAGAYFGLTPSWIWTVLLVMISGMMLFSAIDRSRILQFVAVAGILFGLVFLLFPGENADLSEMDEHWRDQLAYTTVADEQNPTISPPKEDPKPEPEETEEDPVMLRVEKSLDMKTLLIIAVIVLILLLLFVPAVIKDRVQRKREKKREGMYDEDRAVAIQAVFRVALQWIQASGIVIPKDSYSRLTPLLGRDVSESCAEEYTRILPIWQEAVFSDHTMTDGQWDQVLAFEQHIETSLTETASRWQQWKYKYIYAL